MSLVMKGKVLGMLIRNSWRWRRELLL